MSGRWPDLHRGIWPNRSGHPAAAVLADRPAHLARQQAEGWGTRVIDRVAADLRSEFPGMRGFSPRNPVYMRTLAAAYPQTITQQAAAQLPWGHLMVLLDIVPDQRARDWYAAQASATAGPATS